MVERSLSMREALGSMPSFSIFADIQMKLVTVLGQSVLQDIEGPKLRQGGFDNSLSNAGLL